MVDIHANNSPFPSMPGNNPVISPFLQMEHNMTLPLSTVSEETSIGNDDLKFTATPQGPRNMLMDLRDKFPYLPILPVPSNVVTVALAANVPQDIKIPDGTIMGLFFGSGTYYVGLHGNAEIPVAGNQEASKSIYRPERFAFYLANKKALSLISADAACVVTLLTYTFEQLPTY